MYRLVLVLSVVGLAAPALSQPIDAAALEKAMPTEAIAKPAQPRKVLVFTATRGFRHSSIPIGADSIKLLGQKTGAFEATHSEDIAVFEKDSLDKYDAVVFLNTTGELFLPPDFEKLDDAAKKKAEETDERLKKNLEAFITGGKGFAGIHSATDTFYKWEFYGQMIGGYFDGHPWGAGDDVVIRIDDPQHPLAAPMGPDALEFKEEIYQLKAPYDRSKQRVLMTLDTIRTNMKKGGVKRTDNDFGVSWVKTTGKGRVFYCSLGHNEHIYAHPRVLKHYLAGIQFAIGDLKADTTPRPLAAKPAPADGFVELFNGRDLTGWKGLVSPDGGPPARAKMSADELAIAQKAADDSMRAHWKVENGVLVFDGKGQSLCTEKDYGDFELLVDWKILEGGDSGIYLRGSPQVQIWDAKQHPEGSGGLYNNQKNPAKPLVCADKPVGEWNTFRIRMVGDRVWVWLNDVAVVENTVLENYWERDKPIYPRGQIELQNHGNRLEFRNIRIRELPSSEK